MVILKMTLQMVTAPLPSSYSNTVPTSFDHRDAMLQLPTNLYPCLVHVNTRISTPCVLSTRNKGESRAGIDVLGTVGRCGSFRWLQNIRGVLRVAL